MKKKFTIIDFIKLVGWMTLKTTTITLAALFIADDLGLLRHD